MLNIAESLDMLSESVEIKIYEAEADGSISSSESSKLLNHLHAKGYNTAEGYYGRDPKTGKYRLYASERDYLDELDDEDD